MLLHHCICFFLLFFFLLCLVNSAITILIKSKKWNSSANNQPNSINGLNKHKKNCTCFQKTTTNQAEPAGPPEEVKCSSPSSTKILVSWRAPPVELRNGIITQYTVSYAPTEGEDTAARQISNIPPESSQYLLENLEKWTEYRVTVTAHTDVGAGPESLPHLIRTEEDGMCLLRQNFSFQPSKPNPWTTNYLAYIYLYRLCHPLKWLPSFQPCWTILSVFADFETTIMMIFSFSFLMLLNFNTWYGIFYFQSQLSSFCLFKLLQSFPLFWNCRFFFLKTFSSGQREGEKMGECFCRNCFSSLHEWENHFFKIIFPP